MLVTSSLISKNNGYFICMKTSMKLLFKVF